jgi:hypothetical protein
VGLGVTGGEADRLLEDGKRLVEALLALEDGAEVAAGLDVSGAESDGRTERRLRLAEPTQPAQSDTEVVLSVEEVRLKAQGRAAVRHRHFQSAERQGYCGQVAEEHRVRAVDGEGSADEVECLRMTAGLVSQHAEQVQGVRVVRRLLEDAAVEGFGLLKTASLVVANG